MTDSTCTLLTTLPHWKLTPTKGPPWLVTVYHLVCFLPHADSWMSSIFHAELKSAVFHLANIDSPLISSPWHHIQPEGIWIFFNSLLQLGFSSVVCNYLVNGTVGWVNTRKRIANSLKFHCSKIWYFSTETKCLPRRLRIQKFCSGDFSHRIFGIAVPESM
jgi:hypothetical protein